MKQKEKIIKKVNNQVKGITLIALVVTIVVLLILSAVAIGLSVGDNGIITSARNATASWEQGVENEQDGLKQIANFINSNGNTSEENNIKIADVKGGERFEKTETVEDDNGKKVTIPEGFGVAETSNTIVDDGIVITDGINEFVWVPVDDPSTMFIEETVKLDAVEISTSIYSNLRVRSGQNNYTSVKPGDTSSIREPDVLNGYDIDENYYKEMLDFASSQELANEFVREYKAMSDSVKKYHGFYIGRYELTGTVENPTVKAGDTLNAVNWYNAYKACKNVIKNNENVKSTMIYGCQWDEVCSWLKKKGYDTDTNSASLGNYSGNPIDTGSNNSYKTNEIYDLAGNYVEWTQEAYGNNYRIVRGGSCYESGSSTPISNRGMATPYSGGATYNSSTSRVILYVY